jgi:sterol desaturase/sphingolipid hydroxylase (fatty acid hydroxylase superfamily)
MEIRSSVPWQTSLDHGMRMALATLLLTVVFEIISYRTVRDLVAKPNGPALYVKAIVYNLFNHIVLGVPVYVVSESILCYDRSSDDDYTEGYVSWARVLTILVVHSVSYFYVHQLFHTQPGWYQHHAFHHKFKDFIPPSAANAVSPIEYVSAYVLPFGMGALVSHPTPRELQIAVWVVSFCNLLVHMPAMEAIADYVEPVFVSARSHRHHHLELKSNFAAPMWNLDWLGMKLSEICGVHVHESTPGNEKIKSV